MSSNNSFAEEAERILDALNKPDPGRVLRYFSFMYLEIGTETFLLWLNSLERKVSITDDAPMASGSGSSVNDENSVAPPVKVEEVVFAPGISVPSKHFFQP
ncbi:hypothetical protein QVD17_37278 [Tagetes erecta]|uniref:Uncharacterized protein n=1 Tax=Tagetes erecta TaxID=13708 RepID=A0AAD8JTY2_TARER|nr:hypothetical protein QVD17_37278 [Tagetes erecta]